MKPANQLSRCVGLNSPFLRAFAPLLSLSPAGVRGGRAGRELTSLYVGLAEKGEVDMTDTVEETIPLIYGFLVKKMSTHLLN